MGHADALLLLRSGDTSLQVVHVTLEMALVDAVGYVMSVK
jgi:hypothetical protein